MKEVEAIGRAGSVARIQCIDSRDQGGQHFVLADPVFGAGVGEVGEQAEMDVRVHVPERMHLEVLDQSSGALDRRDERGHDHHGAGLLGHAATQVESRQRQRAHQAMDGAMHERHRQLAGREECQRARADLHPWGRMGHACRGHGRADPERGDRDDRAEVERRCMLEEEARQSS